MRAIVILAEKDPLRHEGELYVSKTSASTSRQRDPVVSPLPL
jgi:hypothetical protein